MKLPTSAFEMSDWSAIEAEIHPGETGTASWRTVMLGDVRIRRVDYSPGYLADHWCDRGHILYVLAGELAAHPGDLAAGLAAYESALRDYVVRNQDSALEDRADLPNLQDAVLADNATAEAVPGDALPDLGQLVQPLTLKDYQR